MEQHIYDVIIIGGGPAGYSAALYTARAALDTLVIERISIGGQMTLTGEIENYPGFDEGVDGFTLGMKMMQGAEKFGARTEYAEVSSVELSGEIKKVVTTSGEFLSRVVIIASGANARQLGVEGENELVGRGVHYCAHCDGRFYKGKTVVVVGGGNSAVSDALYLSRLCAKVYLVHRRDTLRATRIYHEPLSRAENVEFVFDSVIDGFIADKRVTAVTVKNVKNEMTSTIECDGVFVSVGREPVTDFLGGALSLDKSGYIIADETTKTGTAGVFAVGDVRTKALRQIVTAASDGAVAAHFAEEYLSGI